MATPIATLPITIFAHIMDAMTRIKQRSRGTGSVYRNARAQWAASIEAGWTERGTRRRMTLKARTEAAVRVRLAEAQRRIAAEGPTAQTCGSITVKRWADQWLEQRQRIVRPGTYVSDRSGVSRWSVPAIGHLRLEALMPADIRKVTTAQEDGGLALARCSERTRCSSRCSPTLSQRGTGSRSVPGRRAVRVPEALQGSNKALDMDVQASGYMLYRCL